MRGVARCAGILFLTWDAQVLFLALFGDSRTKQVLTVMYLFFIGMLIATQYLYPWRGVGGQGTLRTPRMRTLRKGVHKMRKTMQRSKDAINAGCGGGGSSPLRPMSNSGLLSGRADNEFMFDNDRFVDSANLNAFDHSRETAYPEPWVRPLPFCYLLLIVLLTCLSYDSDVSFTSGTKRPFFDFSSLWRNG